jgi:hypothetical protein
LSIIQVRFFGISHSSYVYAVSNIRIWGYEKIIELLEVRLRCYRELAKELPGTDANAQERASLFHCGMLKTSPLIGILPVCLA